MTALSPTVWTFAQPDEPPGIATEDDDRSAGHTSSNGRRRRRVLPIGTLTLIGINVVVWLVTLLLSGPGNPNNWLPLSNDPRASQVLLVFGAKDNALIQSGQYWRLITPIFLHFGIIHLGLNCLALLTLGSRAERIYGSARFLILYLFSGICGSIASYEFNPGPGVGASGAILGLAGVIMVFALRHRERISAGFRHEVHSILAPQVILILVIGFLFPFIDAMAHLGGFLGGCLLAGLMESPLLGPTAMERERLPVGSVFLTGAALLGYALFSVGINIQREMPALVRYRAAQEFAAAQRWPEAAEQLRELVRRYPNRRSYRLDLAEVLKSAGRTGEAITVLEQGVRLDRTDVGLQVDLADALLRGNRGEESVRLLRDVLSRDPRNATALNNLAYAYADTLQSNYAEALDMAKRAVELQPNVGTFWDTLGWVYYRNGQLPKAAAAQERAVGLAGRDAVVRYHLGAIYEAQGRMREAASEYRAALERDAKLDDARKALSRIESTQVPSTAPTRLARPASP